MKSNDVLIAFVPDSDSSGKGKIRPILLIRQDNAILHIFKKTTKYDNKSEKLKKQYYPIQDWPQAGLAKLSWINIGESA
ncbi:hypothetical protein ACYSNU_01930 [Enterococcus sp. LJL120]